MSGCGSGEEAGQKATERTEKSSRAGMHHSGSGEIPNGLQTAEKPTVEPESHAVIQVAHTKGMDGAEAVGDSAEQIIVYMVEYTTAAGGEKQPITSG